MIDAVTVANTSTIVLEENKRRNRILVVLCNNSDEDMYAAPGAVSISTYGIPLIKGGGSWVDKPDPQGNMYQGLYTAICASGGKVISVVELNK